MSTHVAASCANTRKRGFTVIEMIIVLVIVVILAVILYPVIHRPDNSHRPACQSNLKQLGLAMAQYTNDYDSKYPRLVIGFTGAPSPGNEYSWRSAITTYARNEELWKCPTNKTLSEHLSPYDNLPMSYDVADCGPIRRNKFTPESEVKSPAQTIVVFEENGFNEQSQEIGVPWDVDDDNENWTNIVYAGHLGTSNYLYADGHVKSLTPMKTIAGGVNKWHLNVHDAVSPRAREKLLAADRNFK